MKTMKILCVTAAAVILLPLGVWAGEGKFDSEKMLSDLEKKLAMSKEEIAKLKPVLESKSREIKGVVSDTVDQGFAELESMAKGLEAASEKAEKQLKEVLNSEQVKELKAYLGKLDKEALEEVREGLVEEMTALLELSGKQVAELKPILEEQFDRMSALLAGFAKDTGRAYEEFRKEYAAIAWETRNRLEKALDPAQLEKLEKRMEETREKIHKKLFPDG